MSIIPYLFKTIMEIKRFNKINYITAFVVLFIASLTYILTVEPTTSFWDCGEFIASSYKLEVGHPPGNPVFQLAARFFSLFAPNKESVAISINIMSALCSAFTIFFLYLSIVHLGRRILKKPNEELTTQGVVSIIGAGVVGALAYCFSDTFWFSAVEAEVYAMSSLFTAIVFWAMLKWEEQADEPYANRWIVLIALLMGLSIGVHLLNLLTIPALAFIYYYRKHTKYSVKKDIYVLLIAGLILILILYGIIPYLPRLAAWVDLLFVNVMGLPFNSGAAVFMLVLFVLCFWGIYYTYKKNKALLNTILLSFTMIVVGFSIFSVIIIRSQANPPTNEYQPDNPYTLIRYLAREQYGSKPLIYGETFASYPVAGKESSYYTPLNGKYYNAPGPGKYIYSSDSQMLFPRMWEGRVDRYVDFYKTYTENRGTPMVGSNLKKPTMKDNLAFFFDYQVNWMYWRYFMWNFAGRQNDFHAELPGDKIKGNWESGIGFLDRARLGDQSEGPDYLVNNRAKNHYYMLPLLLGLIGLFFHLNRDRRGWWVVMLLFLLTGIAIVVYLNQTPFQVRERDYAYAGSFYAFSVWIGLAVMGLTHYFTKYLSKLKISPTVSAFIFSAICLAVPIQMASQNWDDHNRSNRYTARDIAYNYLMSVDPNAILISFGDNDTFPLWYSQEVEEIRPDVRIVNTSLLGTDWYIDQMKCKTNQSDPLPITIDRSQYLYGTNDWTVVEERLNRPITIKEAINIFKNPAIKYNIATNISVDYIPARKLRMPVNKENVIKYGIVNPKDHDKVLDTLEFNLPESTTRLGKHELILLDVLGNYQWDRPIYFISRGGDLSFGIRDYLQFDGFVYKFVPIKSEQSLLSVGQIDTDKAYDLFNNVCRWESFGKKMHVDYQNLYTFNYVLPIRNVFVQLAQGLMREGKKERAIEMLDMMQSVFPAYNFPLNASSAAGFLNELMVIDAIDIYFNAGAPEKGLALAEEMLHETYLTIDHLSGDLVRKFMLLNDLKWNLDYLAALIDIFKEHGYPEKVEEIDTYYRGVINKVQSY